MHDAKRQPSVTRAQLGVFHSNFLEKDFITRLDRLTGA